MKQPKNTRSCQFICQGSWATGQECHLSDGGQCPVANSNKPLKKEETGDIPALLQMHITET